MKIIKTTLFLTTLFLFSFCGSKKQDSNEEGEYNGGSFDVAKDGTYCADVTYHNPNTGTEKTYQLNVEIESQELLKIKWPNDGWLDDDHFSPVVFDKGGYTSFTSDKGYEYSIQITGPECNYSDADQMDSDVRNDQQKITCPKCGGEKDKYDEFCSSCKNKIENEKEDKEQHTCKKCGNYDSFMFSTDNQCSDCERKEKLEKEENEEEEN